MAPPNAGGEAGRLLCQQPVQSCSFSTFVTDEDEDDDDDDRDRFVAVALNAIVADTEIRGILDEMFIRYCL
jgi:hypothetical protein